jgi:hypothetical protein
MKPIDWLGPLFALLAFAVMIITVALAVIVAVVEFGDLATKAL